MITRDLLWKGIIEDCFDDLLTYFYPDWAPEVDFSQDFEFLDKELIQLFPDADQGQRYADKLVKVFTKSGAEKWVLVHVEVQGYADPHFAERMFIYFYRIFDRFRHPVTALALLADNGNNFHPKCFQYQFLRTSVQYSFDTFKLLDKTADDFLMTPANPFSIILETAWNALKIKGEDNLLQNKIALARRLVASNYPRHKIRKLLNFLRFYLRFEAIENNHKFEKEIHSLEKRPDAMGINELIENAIREEGIEKGIEKGIERGIEKGKQEGIGIAIRVAQLLKRGFSIEQIAVKVSMSPEEVTKIKLELEKD